MYNENVIILKVSTFVYYIDVEQSTRLEYNAVRLFEFVPRFIIARVKDIKE